jgi:hypothetical protein
MVAAGALLSLAGDNLSGSAVFFGLVLTLVVATSVVGGLVASRQPENPIGWILCGFSVFRALSALAAGYAEVAPHEASTGAGRVAAWFFNWSWVSLFALVVFVLLLFPDGRLPSRRWRWARWSGIVGTAALTVGSALAPGKLEDVPTATNPVPAGAAVASTLSIAGGALTAVALVAAVVSVFARYRAAADTARQQIKWLGVAAVFTAVCAVAGLAAVAAGGPAVAGYSVILGSVVAIPLAIAVAMLRYRLYDVDRVISRSLTYGLVTLTLDAAYAGLVLAGQAVFSAVAGGSNLAIAVSTLVVAALFLPVRRRTQELVNRRFYRRRYDAQRTLDAFGARLREELDLDALAGDLRGVVAETVQPAHVSIWLRSERTVTIP